MPKAATKESKPKGPVLKKRKVEVAQSTRPKQLKKKKAIIAEENLVKVKGGVSKAKVEKDGKGKGKEVSSTTDNPAITKPVKSVPQASIYPKTFKIIAGSYEKLLYGLEGTFEEDPGTSRPKPTLKPVFIFPAHVGCVKAVAGSPSGGKWLATGSTDEIVKVWDLRRRKEIGGLIHHEGSITYLTFPSRSHLLSASEDGTLCLFHARDWTVLRVLKGHKGRVNSVAVHPSGKVALSVGKDRTLRMWDLMRGKGAASTKLGKEGEVVKWSPSGKQFAVQSGSTVDLFNTKMALLYTITHPARIHDVKFFLPEGPDVDDQSELLMVAAEDKKVSIYELREKDEGEPKLIAELVGHTNRVRAVELLIVALPPFEESKTTTYATTISSDGFIRVYDMQDVKAALSSPESERPVAIESVTFYDTKGTRLTCLAMADGEPVAETKTAAKRKREDEDEGEASEAEEEEELHLGRDGNDEDDEIEDEGEDEEDEED
ncbi:hypothetical protein M422DRAFT_24052 [Sphaerobolus stellatus SS14]|nr:hypothetical protein M422DRAFT_24052 [Sphaerobolus stellatus SS14]